MLSTEFIIFTQGCTEEQTKLPKVKTRAGGSDRGGSPDAPQGGNEGYNESIRLVMFVIFVQFEDDGGSVMQKLAVQTLCYQLDTTWQYFTRTFKMQVKTLPFFPWDKT